MICVLSSTEPKHRPTINDWFKMINPKPADKWLRPLTKTEIEAAHELAMTYLEAFDHRDIYKSIDNEGEVEIKVPMDSNELVVEINAMDLEEEFRDPRLYISAYITNTNREGVTTQISKKHSINNFKVRL